MSDVFRIDYDDAVTWLDLRHVVAWEAIDRRLNTAGEISAKGRTTVRDTTIHFSNSTRVEVRLYPDDWKLWLEWFAEKTTESVSE